MHCAAKSNVMFTKYCQGYKIEKEKIGRACSMHGRFHYYMLCRSETLNGTENVTQIIVHYSMKEIGWEAWTYMEDINIILILYKCDVAVGLIWLRVLVNREWMFILYIMWKSTIVGETFCFTWRQCCELDDKGIFHQLLAGKSCLSSAKHSDNLWGQLRPLFAMYSG